MSLFDFDDEDQQPTADQGWDFGGIPQATTPAAAAPSAPAAGTPPADGWDFGGIPEAPRRPTYAAMADQLHAAPATPIAGTVSGSDVFAQAAPPTPPTPPETTALPPDQEAAFQQWAQASGIADVDHPDSHYDYRGLFLAVHGQPIPLSTDRHFPDTFKQHGHPTFSVESQYSTGPYDGGTWNGEEFVPPPVMARSRTGALYPQGPPSQGVGDVIRALSQPVGAALGVVTGNLTNIPTAVGESLAGQTLPGHEGETTLQSRLANHAKMILSGRGNAVAPLSIPGAMMNPPNSTVGPQTIYTEDGAAQVPTQVRGRSEMVALETGRRGLDMAAKLITDPAAIAAMGVPGTAGELLANAFVVEGVTAAAQVVTDPKATPEDVAEAVIGAAINAVPAAARIIRPKVEAVMQQARVRAAERIAREKAEAATRGFENARPVGQGSTPLAGGRLLEEEPPTSQGPPLTQAPPPSEPPAAVRPGEPEAREPGTQAPVPSPGESPAAPVTPVRDTSMTRRGFFRAIAEGTRNIDEFVSEELMGDPELVAQQILEIRRDPTPTPEMQAGEAKLIAWLARNGIDADELLTAAANPNRLTDGIRQAAEDLHGQTPAPTASTPVTPTTRYEVHNPFMPGQVVTYNGAPHKLIDYTDTLSHVELVNQQTKEHVKLTGQQYDQLLDEARQHTPAPLSAEDEADAIMRELEEERGGKLHQESADSIEQVLAAQKPEWHPDSPYTQTGEDNDPVEVLRLVAEEQVGRLEGLKATRAAIETAKPGSARAEKLEKQLRTLTDEYHGAWDETAGHMTGVDVAAVRAAVERAAGGPDAVSKPGTTPVDVRPAPGHGEALGGGDATGREVAGTGEAETAGPDADHPQAEAGSLNARAAQVLKGATHYKPMLPNGATRSPFLKQGTPVGRGREGTYGFDLAGKTVTSVTEVEHGIYDIQYTSADGIKGRVHVKTTSRAPVSELGGWTIGDRVRYGRGKSGVITEFVEQTKRGPRALIKIDKAHLTAHDRQNFGGDVVQFVDLKELRGAGPDTPVTPKLHQESADSGETPVAPKKGTTPIAAPGDLQQAAIAVIGQAVEAKAGINDVKVHPLSEKTRKPSIERLKSGDYTVEKLTEVHPGVYRLTYRHKDAKPSDKSIINYLRTEQGAWPEPKLAPKERAKQEAEAKRERARQANHKKRYEHYAPQLTDEIQREILESEPGALAKKYSRIELDRLTEANASQFHLRGGWDGAPEAEKARHARVDEALREAENARYKQEQAARRTLPPPPPRTKTEPQYINGVKKGTREVDISSESLHLHHDDRGGSAHVKATYTLEDGTEWIQDASGWHRVMPASEYSGKTQTYAEYYSSLHHYKGGFSLNIHGEEVSLEDILAEDEAAFAGDAVRGNPPPGTLFTVGKSKTPYVFQGERGRLAEKQEKPKPEKPSTPVTTKPAHTFKAGDPVTADEGEGEIARVRDGDVKIALRPGGTLTNWIPASRVTHAPAKAQPRETPEQLAARMKDSEAIESYTVLQKDKDHAVKQRKGWAADEESELLWAFSDAVAEFPTFIDTLSLERLNELVDGIARVLADPEDAGLTDGALARENVEEELRALEPKLQREILRREGQDEFDFEGIAKAESETEDELAHPDVIVFRSGNQSAIADLQGYIAAEQPVGITIDANARVVDAVVAYAQKGGQVFVDSGAIQELRTGKPPNFLHVMDSYNGLLEMVGERYAGNLHVVAPDKVGDAEETRERQRAFAAKITALLRRGVKVIVPVQVSDHLDNDALHVIRTFEGASLGLPGNKAAITDAQLTSMLAAIKRNGLTDTFAGVHFLGIGEKNARFNDLVAAVRSAFPKATITADSNRTKALMQRGRPAHTEVEQEADEGSTAVGHEDADDFLQHFLDGEFDYFDKPGEIEGVAGRLNVTPDTLRAWAADGTIREHVSDEQAHAALVPAMKARFLPAARSIARRRVIAKHDKKPSTPVTTKKKETPPFEIEFERHGHQVRMRHDRAADRFVLTVDGEDLPERFYSRAAAEEHLGTLPWWKASTPVTTGDELSDPREDAMARLNEKQIERAVRQSEKDGTSITRIVPANASPETYRRIISVAFEIQNKASARLARMRLGTAYPENHPERVQVELRYNEMDRLIAAAHAKLEPKASTPVTSTTPATAAEDPAKAKAREERAKLIADLQKRRGDTPEFMQAPDDKVAKLLRLAANNPNPHEAAAAKKRAQELIEQYQLNQSGPLPPTTFTKLRDASFKLAEKILLAQAKGEPVSAEDRATDAALKSRLDAAYTYLGRHPNAYDEPRFARTDDGKVRTGFGDEGAAARIMASSLYQGDIADVATKELLQNAFDAVREKGDEGRVELSFGSQDGVPWVQVTDNGRGMTRKEIETVFTDLFDSGKRDQATASGGFGIAKASFLLGGQRVTMQTIAEVPNPSWWAAAARSTKKVLTLDATPAQLTSKEGVAIDEAAVAADTPTGTTVRTYLPANASTYAAREFANKLSKYSSDLPGHFIVFEHTGGGKTISVTPAQRREQFADWRAVPVEVAGAKITLRLSPQTERRNYTGIRTLNNGVYQLDEDVSTSPPGSYGGPELDLPKHIIADVRSTVAEGHPYYPFTANRETLRNTFATALKGAVYTHVIKPIAEASATLLQRTYDVIPTVRIGGADVPVLDSGKKLTAGELKAMFADRDVQRLVSVMLDVADKVLTGALEGERDQIERVGILLHENIHGVFIPNPETAARGLSSSDFRATILLNPFQHLVSDPTPDAGAAAVYHTAVHEAAHWEKSGHNEGFTSHLAELFRKLGAKLEVTSLRRLMEVYGEGSDPDALASGVKSALRLYQESRGRAVVEEDALSRTGRHSRGSADQPDGQAGASQSPETDRARAPHAVTKDDVVALIKILDTYKAEGITDFAKAIRQFQDDYGPRARDLDRAFEIAWRNRFKEEKKAGDVLDARPAPAPKPEKPAGPPQPTPLHVRIYELLRARPHLLDDLAAGVMNPQAFRKEVARILANVTVKDLEDQIDALHDATEGVIAQEIAPSTPGPLPKAAIPDAQAIEARMPRAHRTLEKQKLQQFSTPLPIAVLAAHAAQLTPDDVVLEPTAGTGNLLAPILPEHDGGPRLLAMELSERRADLLRAQGYRVQQGDYLATAPDQQPTVIIANPPWGKYATGKYGRGIALGFAPGDVAERFVGKMLRDLADGGRLVAVMPTTLFDAKSFKKWLTDHYAVRALIKSPAGSYDTRATSVESVLLVVDKVKGDGTLPSVVVAKDWPAYSAAVEAIHDRAPLAPGGRRPTDAAQPPAGSGSGGVHQRPRPGGAKSGRHTPVGTGRGPDVVAPGAAGGGGDTVDGGSTPSGAPGTPTGTSAAGVPAPPDVTRREATASRLFAPYVRRTTLRGQPHPKLLVEAKQLAGVAYPPLTEKPTRSMQQAIDAGRISVEQAEQALAVLQANSGEKPFGYLAADAVGVGKSREIALSILGAMDRAKAAKRELRLMLTTKSRDNVEDLLDEIHYVASGKTATQGGSLPFEVYRLSDDYPGAKKTGNDYEPLPKRPHAVYVVDSYNVAAYRQALADVGLHGIVGDEVQRFTNQEAQIGGAWLNLHARIMRGVPRPEQFFAYFTATPAEKVEDYRYLYGLRLWPVDGFAEWLDLVTGGLDAKKAKELEEATERGSIKSIDEVVKDTGADPVGGDAGDHQGAAATQRWQSYASNVFAQRLTPAEGEQIPREWKILGRFSARDLWRAGTTFKIHEATLPDAHVKKYEQFVDLAVDILTTAHKYGLYDKSGRASRFGVSGMLQFAAKRIQMQPALEEAVTLAKQYAAEGYQPVLSILNVSEMNDQRGNLVAAIEKVNTRVVDVDPADPDGGLTDLGEIPEAMVDKARLMDRVRDLGSFADPVDYIAEELGREQVAFIIGKEKASRRKASAEFQTGQRTYAVISSAGSTGINLDQRVKTALGPGHGRRVFIDVQYEWSAREALQRYGRVDRASSIAPPHIVPITFGQAAEKKFLATIANRMAAVGALSKGGAESTGAAGAALEEFEITGDDALAAARRAFEESDEATRRSFATVKSAFRDPNRNGRAPDQPDFDPFKPSATAHGVPMTDFQLPLLLMPQAQANAFWEKFIRYRDELRAESGERNTMRSQRFTGEIIETHPLKPNLDLYAVKNSEGRQFGILVGLITPEMPKLRELLKGANANADTIEDKDWSDTADVRFRRRYVTFTAGDQNITGLQIPWSRIPRVADAYGTAVAGETLDTPEAVRAYLHTGETITLAVVNPDSGKNWMLRWMPGKQRIVIDHARMADRAQLLNNGAEYHPVGSYWAVKDLAKFLERWPVPDQVSAAKAPTKKPSSSGGSGGVQATVLPGAKEFVEQDVVPGLKAIASQMAAAKSDIRALFAPDTMGTPATVFAGTMRANLAAHHQRNQRAQRILRDAEKAMDRLSNETNLSFIDAVESGEIDRLPATIRPIAEQLRGLLDAKRAQVQKRGRLQQYIEHYFPHEWKDPSALKGWIDRLLGRKPLQGTKAFLKKRSIPTVAEGVALGFVPVSYNPVTLVLRKLVEMDKWIMAYDILHDARAQGVAKFVRVGDKAPEGWVRYHDSFGTVYGEPVVKVKEAYDPKVMHGLYEFARALGVRHVRKVNLGGQRWGYAVGDQAITTKFAGPEGVLMHEIGHILDERYGLRGQWVNNPKFRQELRDLADLRNANLNDVPLSRKRYVRKGEEKIANVIHAFIYAPEKTKEVAPRAYWAVYNLAKDHPELKPLIDLQKARSLTLDVETNKVPVGGIVIRGHYYGPPEATRLLDNYLSPGLRRNAAFNAYRRVGNFMNQVQLGLSLFHLTMTGAEAVVSKFAQALQEAERAHTLAARGEFTRSVVEAMNAGKHLAQAPAATFIDLFHGHQALQAFYKQDANARSIATITDQIIQGGGGVGWDSLHHDNMVESFMRALRQGNVWGAAWRTVPMFFEAVQKPIMDWWVPRLKLGAYLDLAAMELRTLGESPDLTEVRRVLGGVWDNIDNRFGELRYDNLFWHNALKDLGMASVRALGWNVGTIREVFGAPSQQAARLLKGTKDVRMRHTGYDENGRRIFESEAEPWLTSKAAYVVGMVLLYGFMGALYNLAHTGEWPKELRDYFFPRTGHAKPDGTPERVSIPGYFKDAWAVLHDLPGSALTTAAHKLNPLLNALYEMFDNEDYFGTEIRNPEDPLVQQAEDLFKFFTVDNMRPISIQSYERRKASRGGTGISGVESFFGINEAPASIYRTKAELLMRRYAPPSTHTKEQAADMLATRDLRDAVRRGDRDAAAEAARRGLSQRQIENALRTSNLTPLQRGFQHLTLEQALHVYEVATEEERTTLITLLHNKAASAFKNGGMLPAEQADLVQRLRKAVALPRAAGPSAPGRTPVTGAK